ncbi:SusD/RagB family nutrient-binding outer membrane lipoprotein [Pleomorphovibrio marinus]|uniref:SusD/RagB family nutrient-binding outer membrane lipoprotein n=1 Tax=Pleomorphovibrio marinus TaxID=2164132 RepID=UPI000E0AD26F|nr:SusD/RagB family nutrient-binding outer membrane lipoprotein [Pleomorphovibrio marinus]
MKIFNLRKVMGVFFALSLTLACDSLDEINENPNGVSPSEANPNLLMPSVMRPAATSTLDLGIGDIAGTVQHTQKDGWFTGHNQFEWGLRDWTGWYNMLRTNNFLQRRSEELGMEFHRGVSLTMKSYIFGMITDLWGDAPYNTALRGDQDGLENEFPAYDNQEDIYPGIIQDLQSAAQIFATGNSEGVIPEYDLYFGGNATMWHKFTNSLILRFAMRVSEKLPDLAQQSIEQVYNSGVYLTGADEDVSIDFIGAASGDSWPTATDFDAGSQFRRFKPCNTLLDRLVDYEDPRLGVWVRPVHCQWVEDLSLDVAYDPYIRENGEILEGRVSFLDVEYVERIAAGNKYTRHYNPEILGRELDTREYVGLPQMAQGPSDHNLNPTGGQQLENQHVSQLADVYRERTGGILQARVISASEVHFILAEASQRGWSTGDAEANYNNAIRYSLETWGVDDDFEAYIERPEVAYDGSLQRIIEQKWIASWTTATESWFDWRRTGYPELEIGEAAPEPQIAVRFTYGNNEINFNAQQVGRAVDRLEVSVGESRGRNNQWAKPWLLQGTGKPW